MCLYVSVYVAGFITTNIPMELKMILLYLLLCQGPPMQPIALILNKVYPIVLEKRSMFFAGITYPQKVCQRCFSGNRLIRVRNPGRKLF